MYLTFKNNFCINKTAKQYTNVFADTNCSTFYFAHQTKPHWA